MLPSNIWELLEIVFAVLTFSMLLCALKEPVFYEVGIATLCFGATLYSGDMKRRE